MALGKALNCAILAPAGWCKVLSRLSPRCSKCFSLPMSHSSFPHAQASTARACLLCSSRTSAARSCSRARCYRTCVFCNPPMFLAVDDPYVLLSSPHPPPTLPPPRQVP